MSISASLFNAYTGLTAASRQAEVIALNVSNALTPGFGRREVQLTAASLNGQGAGVRVSGVDRQIDQIALAERRLADASLGGSAARADAKARLETVIGIPGETGSLADLTTSLEVALVQAASRPDSQTRLVNVFRAASDLTRGINATSQATQNLRMEADAQIADDVKTLNTSLQNIQDLNSTIRLNVGGGKEINSLLDQRQLLIDQISAIVPIKTYPRDHAQIAITTTGGAVLLDGGRAEIGFDAAGVITPDMTLNSGALSGLTLNGKLVGIPDGSGLMNGGSLEAHFDIRDKIAPKASAQIDAITRNLIERFQDNGLDPSLAVGAAGLFTDNGAAMDPLLETGLAGRMTVNTAVDPAQGGAIWRLRDGVGATAPGDTGNSQLLSAMATRLNDQRIMSSGEISVKSMGLGEAVDVFSGLVSQSRLESEASQSFHQTRLTELQAIELQSGVDTDHELQRLLLVEQAYAANARVISIVDQMLRSILEL